MTISSTREIKGASFVSIYGAQGEIDRIITEGLIVFDVTPYIDPMSITMACITYGHHRSVMADVKEGLCATVACS